MIEKIQEILAEATGRNIDFEAAVSSRPELGHYSTNAAMRLAKTEGRKPLELAEEWAKEISAKAPAGFFEKVEAAPPGFINFWLSSEAVRGGFADLRSAGSRFGRSQEGAGRRVIIEHSSLNIAKPIHVGHLRNAVIGDSLANIHDALGYEVVRWDYLGDWGTQFGKLIAAYKLWGEKAEVERAPIAALTALYVRFHEEIKSDPSLEERGRAEFRKLEEGDEENRSLWEWFKAESLAEFHRVFGELGIVFDVEIGESFFEKDMKPLLAELEKKGVAVGSEGALIANLPDLPPALLRKSDGTSLYLTRDVANLRYRLAEYAPARILYVVGNEQSLHFSQLFALAGLLGLSEGVELAHVKYGLVLDEGGRKFATREGRSITLEEILEKAKDLARKVVEEKNPDLPAETKAEVAHAVAIGALKHANLKENRHSDIVFDWKKMLDFSGESGPYLQYTHARLRSILRKAEDRREGDYSELSSDLELALIRKMLEYPDTVRAAARTLAPNLLAAWMYELASAANRFYEATPVLKDEDADRRNARLDLVESAAAVLKDALGLLGILAPERI